MSLKSGLLAESTWALDTLNILLRDDTSVGYFYLKHHQSLLSTLVDHFKETLLEIFNLEFDNIPTYVKGHEGTAPSAEQGRKNGEKVSEKWLLKVTSSDFDVLSRAPQQQNSRESSSSNGKKEVDENGNGESKDDDDDMEDGGYSIPVVNVFDTSLLRLGKSDSRLHVQMPRADEGLFFPEVKERPMIMSEEERKELEESARLQRIDQTPVAHLLKREALLSQIPLHRFGRLSRSPRRRERSFYEEIRQRESLSRAEEDHSSTAGSSKGSISEESKTRNECISPDMPDKVFAYNLASSPKSAQMLTEECEIHQKEVLPLWSISPSRELLQGRCLCISNILRSLSFIPGNDYEFCQHPNILIILGRLLMLHHYHLIHTTKKPQSPAVKSPPPIDGGNRGSDGDSPMEVAEGVERDSDVYVKPDEPHFDPASDFWWWDCLKMLQENTLIILSNIAGQLDLSVLPELVSYPIIDGLLHWAVCPASLAIDPLSDGIMIGNVSPQRLVLETLAKMSITEVNVDFVLATPPLTRLDLLFSQLCEFIGQRRFPVVKQFALVLLSNLAQGNEVASRLIGQQKMVVSLLIECIEVAEHTSCITGGALLGGYNPDDPNSLSIAMLRRAATTLHCLAKVPANRTAFLPYRDRMLYLATSQYVEPSISSILMDMLFEFGKL